MIKCFMQRGLRIQPAVRYFHEQSPFGNLSAGDSYSFVIRMQIFCADVQNAVSILNVFATSAYVCETWESLASK